MTRVTFAVFLSLGLLCRAAASTEGIKENGPGRTDGKAAAKAFWLKHFPDGVAPPGAVPDWMQSPFEEEEKKKEHAAVLNMAKKQKRQESVAKFKAKMPSKATVLNFLKAAVNETLEGGRAYIDRVKFDMDMQRASREQQKKEDYMVSHYIALKEQKAKAAENAVKEHENQQWKQFQAYEEAKHHREQVKKHEEKVARLHEHKVQLREHKREQGTLKKRGGRVAYTRNPPGKPCDGEHWLPVTDKEECQLAAKTLQGIDQTIYHRDQWDNRGYGCLWYSLNGHVDFNTVHDGDENPMDEHICKQAHPNDRSKKKWYKQEQEALTEGEARLEKKMIHDVRKQGGQPESMVLEMRKHPLGVRQ